MHPKQFVLAGRFGSQEPAGLLYQRLSQFLRTGNSGNIHESLSSAKNSFRRSSEASRKSLSLSSLLRATEFISVSSRATTTTGTGVAFLAVLGLKTRVFVSSKVWGADGFAVERLDRHFAGESETACDTTECGVTDNFESLVV